MMAARPKHVALSNDVLLQYKVVLVPCLLLRAVARRHGCTQDVQNMPSH